MIINLITGAMALIIAALLFSLSIWLFVMIWLAVAKLHVKWMTLQRAERIGWVIGLPLFLCLSYWAGHFLESFGYLAP